MKPLYLGIDYSLSCPALTFWDGENPFSYSSCSFYFFSNQKKYKNFSFDRVKGSVQREYDLNSLKEIHQRYEDIKNWVYDCICKEYDWQRPLLTFIEGYSMGSKGKVFHIAENTGILKHAILKSFDFLELVPPTIVKKFATGKGNANKEKMQLSFENEFPHLTDLKKTFMMTNKQDSPLADIIDSYYICKYGVEHGSKI